MRDPIVMTWDEWRSSRAAKRENLRWLGLAASSRRTTDYGPSCHRLRRAFGGARVPAWSMGENDLPAKQLRNVQTFIDLREEELMFDRELCM